MSWEVKKAEELGFIETLYTGPVTEKDVHESTLETLSVATGDGPHLFLADFSDAHTELSIEDIFFVPDQWEAVRASKRNRLAVVVPKRLTKPKVSWFCEDVAKSRGWNLRAFETRQAAIDWLKK